MTEAAAYMRRALRLAERGRGRVSPNPMVGAVLVRGGQVVGEGAHQRLGGEHAEVNAFARAGEQARGATLYVTLEPCSVHGRTPPCTEAIVRAKVDRVVCAMIDPDPRVNGRGVERLRRAGLQVEVGLLADEAARLNAAYLKHRSQGLPLVVLKLAQTLDGRIATRTGQSRWITGEAAHREVHRWRARLDAVMVGAGTVLADDPELTVRLVRGRDPRPLVVDGRLRVPPTARVFSRSGAVLVTGEGTDPECRDVFTRQGVEVWTFPAPGGRLDLRLPLARAAAAGMTSVLLEGGAGLAAAALRDRVVDQVQVYLAPILLGEGIASLGDLGITELRQAIGLEEVRVRKLGSDLLYTASVRYPCSPV
ncbi:MAG: bifunctional diaminohydroxyphosphoribosylaminopyrimidine deaminase/5-amino-6-(5-phosphoribosylamino)uracil reductase RibD [Candidatus Latescibacterota bacterium]|jgi:diaminohydroxyphosphoribosylaminopyrimidine deaminase/5-amino-6-(5-phosphoribosylamino)uracil reductase